MAKTSVTIVGAGPTGLAAALALNARGFKVRIIERNSAGTNESRAVGLNRRSLLHLETVGASQPILEVAETLKQARFFYNEKPLTILNIPQPKSGPPPMVALPQSSTEKILANCLKNAGIEVKWSTKAIEISQTENKAYLKSEERNGKIEIESDFILGADGSRSITRKSLGGEFEGHQYEGQWQLIDAELDWPWPDTQAVSYLEDPGHVLFMITLGDGRHRVIGNWPDLEGRLRKLMPVGEISWRNEFKLSERCVASYGQGRIWLAGDAAHVHSPVGGMGMNLGIDDAFDFTKTLMTGNFKDFEQRRMKAAKKVMITADRGFRMITSCNPFVKFLRNNLIRLIGATPYLQKKLAELAFAADAERFNNEYHS